MKSTLWWLGLIFGTLSVVMLVKHGFEVSFVSSLQMVLDYYEQAMQVLFGWAEPGIRAVLSVLRNWIDGPLVLAPIWKHVFAVLFIVLVSVGRARINADASESAIIVLLATISSLLGSVGFSILISVPTDDLNQAAMVWMTAAVYLPIFSFDFFLSVANIMRPHRKHQFARESDSRWSMLQWSPGRWIAVYFVGSAVTWIFVAFVVNAQHSTYPPVELPLATVPLTAATIGTIGPLLGYAIVSGTPAAFSVLANFAGAAVFLLINAGLKLAGL